MKRMLAGVEAARTALNAYVGMNGSTGTCECDVVDLVADLLHFVESQGVDSSGVLSKAGRHFEAETQRLPAIVVAARALAEKHH
jgi:hypothetical protein